MEEGFSLQVLRISWLSNNSSDQGSHLMSLFKHPPSSTEKAKDGIEWMGGILHFAFFVKIVYVYSLFNFDLLKITSCKNKDKQK